MGSGISVYSILGTKNTNVLWYGKRTKYREINSAQVSVIMCSKMGCKSDTVIMMQVALANKMNYRFLNFYLKKILQIIHMKYRYALKQVAGHERDKFIKSGPL